MHTCLKYATIVKRRKNKRTKKKGLYINAFTRLFMRIMNFCVSTSICIFVCLCAFAYIDICIHPCVYAYHEFSYAYGCTPIFIFVCLCFCLVAMTYLIVPTTWLTRSHHLLTCTHVLVNPSPKPNPNLNPTHSPGYGITNTWNRLVSCGKEITMFGSQLEKLSPKDKIIAYMSQICHNSKKKKE